MNGDKKGYYWANNTSIDSIGVKYGSFGELSHSNPT